MKKRHHYQATPKMACAGVRTFSGAKNGAAPSARSLWRLISRLAPLWAPDYHAML